MKREKRQRSMEPDLPELQCLCAALRRATRAVTQLYQHDMKGSGIAPTQFTILKALAYAGEISQGTLGSVLAIDNTTLTRTVARLQERGWVDVRPGLDRRERRLRLTARGFHRLSRAEQRWKDAQERLLLLLGKKEWNRLHESLYRLTRSVLRP